MPLAYALGDALCLFSDTPAETWGLVVNEALACGRPVIVSECCGCAPDLVEGKGTGWVVPAGDVRAASSALNAACARRSEWPAMGERGWAVVANHSFARMAESITAALSSLNSRAYGL